jgi:bifunctional UDP-N-acetylglucosamine pyrophosphorylase/glucosamine-1-phosphate N-acetyltransferase
MADLHVVILAAGKGTRMNSALPKVLHRVAGLPMVEHVLRTAGTLRPHSTTLVIGHQAEKIRAVLAAHTRLGCVVQEPQLGTAHALRMAEPALAGASGTLVLLSGDVPLLSAKTLKILVERHEGSDAAATVVTADVENPGGYGRVVRDGGKIARIVEERDATAAEKGIREINAGIYAFALDGLFSALSHIASANAQREYYLPDVVALYRQRGLAVETLTVADSNEIRGINNRMELAAVSKVVWRAKNDALMAAGVTIEDPDTTYVDPDVTVGADTIVHPGVTLQGTTTIGSGCEIHSGVRILDSRLGNRVTVLDHCVIVRSELHDDAAVGPFAHLRFDVQVAAGARVGNFVEMKKTELGPGSKAMHLAYLGDATIGSHVNIGAGTITCNYDGVTKKQTTIEDGAFVGSDTQLIAPVTVGKGAYIGSGTTVRQDVPAGALAVSAGTQRNIEGWAAERAKRRPRTKDETAGTNDQHKD